MKLMMTPKFQSALKKFQSDPQGALELYGNDPEIMETIRWFSGRMGDEILKRGEAEEQKQKTQAPLLTEVSRKPLKPKKRDVKPEQMQQWLSNPQIRNVLSNPGVCKIIQRLQSHPDEWSQYTNHPKINTHLKNEIIQRA